MCRYKQCGERTHVFWAEDPVCKFIDYLRQSRLFANKIYIISHNSPGYDAQFLLRKFLEMRWTPQLIMDGTKILGMVIENLHSLDYLKFLPVSLKRMLKSFGRYCDSLPKGVYFHQLKKQIPKCTACLPQYIGIVHAAGQKLFLIAKILSYFSPYHSKNCVPSSPEMQSATLYLGSG